MGIRHEVNNSLAALRGELQLLWDSGSVGLDDREGLQAALQIGDRIAAAIRRLEDVEALESVEYLGSTRMLDLSPEAPEQSPHGATE
jgi:signal transduction histidine kinase